MRKLLLLGILLAPLANCVAADWFTADQNDQCLPLSKIGTMDKIDELGIDVKRVNSPESLADALKAKGIRSTISPIKPSMRQIIEINAPKGAFWLVLAQARDCKGYR